MKLTEITAIAGGLEFVFEGDVVWWLWSEGCYISLGFEGRFQTLSELHRHWDSYFAACGEFERKAGLP